MGEFFDPDPPAAFLNSNEVPWHYDDEDKPENPYVQIYGDDGCVAALYYHDDGEREQLLAFARFVVMLVNERYSYRA